MSAASSSSMWHSHEWQGVHFRHAHGQSNGETTATSTLATTTNVTTPGHGTDTNPSSTTPEHEHDGLVLGEFDKKGIYHGDVVLPVRAWTLKDWVWPTHVRPHPWYDVLPVHHFWFRHSAAFFNSSGIHNAWPGGLILLTQGVKILIFLFAFVRGVEEEQDERDILRADYISMGCVGTVLLASWCWVWQDRPNCVLSLVNWCFYYNGWTLSALTFLRRLPRGAAFVIIMAVPVWIFVRTALLFVLGRARWERFLLAAISNRSVPLSVNFHVVGPKETWDSHRFLVMLNLWTFFATIGSKVIVFALDPHLPGYQWAIHIIHLMLALYTAVYQIRCRQIALDSWIIAKDKLSGRVPSDIQPSSVDASEMKVSSVNQSLPGTTGAVVKPVDVLPTVLPSTLVSALLLEQHQLNAGETVTETEGTGMERLQWSEC